MFGSTPTFFFNPQLRHLSEHLLLSAAVPKMLYYIIDLIAHTSPNNLYQEAFLYKLMFIEEN